MNDLSINLHRQNGALVIELGGDIGIHAADTLQRALTPIVAQGTKLTVIDLTRVTMLASVAIGAVIAYHGGAKLHGGQTRIVAAPGNVRDSLIRSRIDAVIPIHESVEAAVGSGVTASGGE